MSHTEIIEILYKIKCHKRIGLHKTKHMSRKHRVILISIVCVLLTFCLLSETIYAMQEPDTGEMDEITLAPEIVSEDVPAPLSLEESPEDYEDAEPMDGEEIYTEEIGDEQATCSADETDTVDQPSVLEGETAEEYTPQDGVSQHTLQEDIKPYCPFSDVQDTSHAYYESICWAGNTYVSGGYSDGTFRSDNGCTRGEFIMFLWKRNGRPSPSLSSNSRFKDVPSSHPFYKAILWASQKGIAKGYSDGSFGMNIPCTRGHALMFLWKCAGKPDANGSTGFSDVLTAHPYYRAICWGVRNGITKGFSDGTFGVDRNCTRGQAVTFLYRDYLNSFYTTRIVGGRTRSICSPVYEESGRRYEKILTIDKSVISIPTVPQKVLFIGNSLLQGLGSKETGGRFGMCASDSRHDYAHIVSQEILSHNPQAVFAKMSGTAFEGCVDTATAFNWYSSKRESFDSDLDLIIIQLADNANTAEKEKAFKKNIGLFLKWIKNDCPRARVICVASWYKQPGCVSAIMAACKANGCDFVSISNIISGATMPVAGTVITYNDGSTAVAAGGSLSHPNDAGMTMIAERLIEILQM